MWCRFDLNTPHDIRKPERAPVRTLSDLPPRVIVGYGLPGLIAALPVIPVAVLLPSWYARDLGLGLIVTSLVLAAARIIDFTSDICVGILVDRPDWHGGRYKPLVLCGALIAGIGLITLASPPSPATPWSLALGSIVLFSGWTLLIVPYYAWGAELSNDPQERSRLVASREVASLCGMLLAVGLPLVVAKLTDSLVIPTIELVSIAAVAFGLPALIGFALLVPEPAIRTRQHTIKLTDIASLWRLHVFRWSLTCWFVNGIANSLPAVLFPIVVKDYFGLKDDALYLLLLCYFGAAALAIPLWLGLAQRKGKACAWMVAIILNVLIFAQVLWLDQNTVLWFVLICVGTGATLGADLVLPASLQADILGRDRDDSGRRRTATAFALWSMATKLAIGIAVLIAFAGLGLSGTTDNGVVGSNTLVLLGLYVVVPIALKCSVIRLLRRIDTSASVNRDSSTKKC